MLRPLLIIKNNFENGILHVVNTQKGLETVTGLFGSFTIERE